MEFRVEVDIPEMPFKIDRKTPILSLGSCFSQRIGRRLHELIFQVEVDPFGVIYDPISISNALMEIAVNKVYSSIDLQKKNDLFFSFSHSTLFSGADKIEVLDRINSRIEAANAMLREAPLIMITLGTAWAFRNKEMDRFVANCHKLPGSLFERELLSVDRIVTALSRALNSVKKVVPQAKILFTVSPVRHLRDGLVNDQLGKSTLFVALNELRKEHSDLLYFPAFELLQHELRDYRFYAEDMTHPSEQASEYIWEQFENALIQPFEHGISKRIGSIQKAMQHRVQRGTTAEHQKFLQDQLDKIEELLEQHPELDLSAQASYFREALVGAE